MNAQRPPALKIAKLPDRTPVKMTIALPPALHSELLAYARLYQEAHGIAEPLEALVPHMLMAFLSSDQAFARSKKNRASAILDK